MRPRPSPIFPLRSVSPSAFSNPPTRSLPNHFLLLSTYSFSAICHSRLSLGKLQLFYVLDLPPYPSLPPLLLCLFPSGSPLRCRLSCLFSSRLHYCLFYALSMSAYVCLYAVLELKRWSSVPSFVFLLHPPPPHSPLAFCSLRERSLSCLRLSLAHTFSFPSLYQSSRARGNEGEVIWLVYTSAGLFILSPLLSSCLSLCCSHSIILLPDSTARFQPFVQLCKCLPTVPGHVMM